MRGRGLGVRNWSLVSYCETVSNETLKPETLIPGEAATFQRNHN